MPFTQQQIDAGLRVQPGGTYGLVQNIRTQCAAAAKLIELGIEFKIALWGKMPPPPRYWYGYSSPDRPRPMFLHFFSEAELEIAYWCEAMNTLDVFLEPRKWGADNFLQLTSS